MFRAAVDTNDSDRLTVTGHLEFAQQFDSAEELFIVLGLVPLAVEADQNAVVSQPLIGALRALRIHC